MSGTCCSRLSKWYMITTNLLFACLGAAFVVFGVIGNKGGFKGSTLFPENTYKLVPVLGAIIIVAALLGIIGAFVRRKTLVIIYLFIVLVALVYQIVIGIGIYKKAADPSGYLAPIWSKGSDSFRAHLQTEFSCCGYNNANDQPAVSDTCNPSYVHTAFVRVYAILFAALAVEILALSNGITILCTRAMYGDEDEDERARRRKSGIRLDDMSMDTASTANHNVGEDNYSRSDRYDSYDVYRHNNGSNAYQTSPYNSHQNRYY
ncbi:Tetraspanin family-domain-containing protein [Syncephalastrum racemosum]|uniref:Tetraspanin family-domain-containing protein n=1 Tax=Syncephalastrum racemosum TaxID=13706 RepID=A0A1X2H7S9_SYNRA|nr:Tetraspanin family-domain-containing protein [Syncephalastrum racemosum]